MQASMQAPPNSPSALSILAKHNLHPICEQGRWVLLHTPTRTRITVHDPQFLSNLVAVLGPAFRIGAVCMALAGLSWVLLHALSYIQTIRCTLPNMQ